MYKGDVDAGTIKRIKDDFTADEYLNTKWLFCFGSLEFVSISNVSMHDMHVTIFFSRYCA